MKKVTILIIENNQAYGGLLKNVVEAEGWDATLVRSGEEGLEMVQAINPDLILLDLILTKKSGHQVLKELRETSNTAKNTPIVIITHLSFIEERKAIEEVATELLYKGDLDVTVLPEIIKKHLAHPPTS